MVIAPVSLIFFRVPSSSSALACPAQNAAASARPIIRRCFIRTLLPWMTSGMPAKIGPEWDLTFDRHTTPRAHVMARSLHEPVLIQLGAFGARVERRRGGIDHLLERGVILAQHDAVRLRFRERVLRDHIGVRLFRTGGEA